MNLFISLFYLYVFVGWIVILIDTLRAYYFEGTRFTPHQLLFAFAIGSLIWPIALFNLFFGIIDTRGYGRRYESYEEREE